jgi:hypothetical protein
MSANPLKKINLESLNGKWFGTYKNSNIILIIKKNNTCSLEFFEIKSSESEIFNGDCNIYKNQTPYTFAMTNIFEINTSLYSLIVPIKDNIIHFTEFSNKRKLRPISLTHENTIIFERHIN